MPPVPRRPLIALAAGLAALLLACRREPPPDPELPGPFPTVAVQPAPAVSASALPSATASALPPPSAPASAPAPGAPRFAFDFDDADLPELTRLLGAITGKRFILTGKLPVVHATVRSPEPVTAAEAYSAFLAILQSNGLTVVQSGPFWKILPSPGVPPEH